MPRFVRDFVRDSFGSFGTRCGWFLAKSLINKDSRTKKIRSGLPYANLLINKELFFPNERICLDKKPRSGLSNKTPLGGFRSGLRP